MLISVLRASVSIVDPEDVKKEMRALSSSRSAASDITTPMALAFPHLHWRMPSTHITLPSPLWSSAWTPFSVRGGPFLWRGSEDVKEEMYSLSSSISSESDASMRHPLSHRAIRYRPRGQRKLIDMAGCVLGPELAL